MLPGFCSLKHSRWDKVRADNCCMDSIFALHAKFHSKWFIKSNGTELTGTIVSQSVNTDQPSRASNVDDMAMVSFDHSREECFTSLCGERKKKLCLFSIESNDQSHKNITFYNLYHKYCHILKGSLFLKYYYWHIIFKFLMKHSFWQEISLWMDFVFECMQTPFFWMHVSLPRNELWCWLQRFSESCDLDSQGTSYQWQYLHC